MNAKLLPLGVLAAADGETIEGITHFQKLVFLAQRERDGGSPYTFRPRDYGPFSKELYADIDKLERTGFVDCKEVTTDLGITKQVYELTEKGERAVDRSDAGEFPIDASQLEDLLEVYGDMSLWDLLEYVYETYSGTTRNSELSI
jgi:uncharacterized protein YwgA